MLVLLLSTFSYQGGFNLLDPTYGVWQLLGTFIIFYVISCGLLGFVSLLSAGRLPGHFIWGQFAKYRLGALLRVGLPAQGGVL